MEFGDAFGFMVRLYALLFLVMGAVCGGVAVLVYRRGGGR